MTEPAAVYGRISEDPRHLEAGVTRQREDCEALARHRGWPIVGTWIDNDIGVLQAGAHRPEYEAMMRAVDRGEVTRIVAYGLARLWRNRSERAAGIERLKARGVSVALVKGQDLDLTSAAGRMYAGVIGEFDTAESEIKSERVARAALQRAEEGKANGHLAFGWRRERVRDAAGNVTDWRDVVDPEHADVVREIVDRLLAHDTLVGIAKDLTARKVPTPRAALRQASSDPDAPPGAWGTGTVRKIAMRGANVGRVVRDRADFGTAQAPGIVDQRKHERVIALLSNPARTTTSRRSAALPGHERPGARRHLLTYGIGRCGNCGSHLRVATRGGRALYVCDTAAGCVGRRKEWVDDLVGRVVVERLRRSDLRDLLQCDDAEASAALERAAGLRARLATAADAYAEGEIDRDQLKRITERLRPELAEAAQASTRAVQGIAPELLAELAGPRAAEYWDEFDVSRRRSLLEAFGMAVTILPVRGGPGFKPESVKIAWSSTRS